MEKSPASKHLVRGLSLAPELNAFVRIEALLVLVCGLTEIFCNLFLHLTGVYVYPYYDKNEILFDFVMFGQNFRNFHHLDFFVGPAFLYPAPVAMAYEMFFYFRHPQRHFIGFVLLSFLLSGCLLGRALMQRGARPYLTALFIACSLLMAYPMWFDLKQGNIEICVWAVVTTGVWAFFKGKSYSAAACFGIAGSMKIFPFVYLGLLLSRRKYREVAFAILVAFVATITSLWLLGNDIVGTWRHVQSGLDQFRVMYVLPYRPSIIGFDHSLFALYKRLLHGLGQPKLTLYLALAAVSGVILYFTKIRRLPLINQVLCLCVASILLPPFSADYTLMHLYVPWGLLVLFAQEQWRTKNKAPGLMAAFVCFAVLMAPESEFIYHTVRFGGQIKAVTLIVLMYIALKYPFNGLEPASNAQRTIDYDHAVAVPSPVSRATTLATPS